MTSLCPGCLADSQPVDAVIAEAANAFGVSVDDLTGDSRQFPLVRYRHVAMAAARSFGHSFPVIGRAFGGRDHTTVIHGVRKVEANERMRHQAKMIAEAVQNTAGRMF